MAIVYPAAIDSFSVPTDPENTSLSSAGTSTRNHTQSHQDLGTAIVALETNATPLDHDHSGTDGDGVWPTNQLAQANTHLSPDTDATIVSLHHTLGPLPTQAAAGNHAHDYEGASIFNKPYVICTSTTRPLDPPVGMLIYESDTNIWRAWTEFPGNIAVSGVNYKYNFNTANSATALDSSIFAQTYVVGASPADGAMGAPTTGVATWHRGANVTCRCVAKAVVAGAATTDTDDQVLTWVTGTTQLQGRSSTNSATNDGFLRMSADEQSYVRFTLDDQGVAIYYTKSGPSGEALLGAVKATANYINTEWVAKAIGATYVLYIAGQQALAVVDYQNVVNIGPGYRGWGIGMTAAAGGSQQVVPNSLASVQIADIPFHTENLIWQVLNIGAVPHIRAESHFRQVVLPGSKGSVVGFDYVIGDWGYDPYMDVDVSQTDITIKEPGHYNVHCSIPWDPFFSLFDQAAVGVSVNGVDIGRKTVSFMRGNGYSPGFPQTLELFFAYYFGRGDILRVHAQHNAEFDSWLWWWQIPPEVQTCWVSLDFTGP